MQAATFSLKKLAIPWSKTRLRCHSSLMDLPPTMSVEMVGTTYQKGSGWNDAISSDRATTAPSVGVWQGP